MENGIIVAVLSGFAAAALAPVVCRLAGRHAGLSLALVPLAIFIFFLEVAGRMGAHGPLYVSYEWIPSFGIDFSFNLDGLGLLFALIISGIGFTVFVYANAHMHRRPALGRFYAFLLFFMASMLGLVLADNLIVFFIFWELTTIGSFLLIGFEHAKEKGARALTGLLQNGYLSYYVMFTVLAATALIVMALPGKAVSIGMTADAAPPQLLQVLLAALISPAVFLVVCARTRLVAIVSLGVVGYGMSLFYFLFGAPDLAMTQFGIETLSVVLLMLVLVGLPPCCWPWPSVSWNSRFSFEPWRSSCFYFSPPRCRLTSSDGSLTGRALRYGKRRSWMIGKARPHQGIARRRIN